MSRYLKYLVYVSPAITAVIAFTVLAAIHRAWTRSGGIIPENPARRETPTTGYPRALPGV